MHLGNSVVCPVTGAIMLGAMGISALFAYKKAKVNFSKERILPLVLMSAFVFVLQTLNFSFPNSFSSAHIIGTILLCSLFGSSIGFLAISSVLLIQALFFADGGLLTLGCNLFNMGFLACFVAYPLFFKPLKNNHPFLGIILSSIIALQLGSIASAIEISASVSKDAVMPFLALMMGSHLISGIVEGIFSSFIYAVNLKYRFDLKFSSTLGFLTLIFGTILSNFASKKPDGLEWSMLKMSDSFVINTQNAVYRLSEVIQSKTAFLSNLPDSISNLSGIILITLLMFILCKTLVKTTNEN